MPYERHPLSIIWGDLPEDEFRELVASVEEWGFEDPNVTVHEGKILDAWHRYLVAEKLGRTGELVFNHFAGDDPATYVIRKNAHRRHLTAGQRAGCIVACREWAPAGRPQNSVLSTEFPPLSTTASMAGEAGVSPSTIEHAKAAERAGLGDAVRSGEMSPRAAAEQVREQSGASAKSKEPTRTQKLEAQVDALTLEVQEKARRIEELEREIRETRGQQSEYPHEREAVANEREAVISALRGSVNEWQTKHNDERRRANFWEREARRLGWQLKPTQSDQNEQPDGPVETTAVVPPSAEADGPDLVDNASKEMETDFLDTGHDDRDFEDDADYTDEDYEDDPTIVAAPPDQIAALRIINGFTVGDLLVTNDGKHVMFQGRADDGGALVVDEYGVGRGMSIDWDRLSRPEDKHGTD